MADKCFFHDDMLRLEAQALVKGRLLLLSDNISTVLCFNRGRSRHFKLLTQIRRFASVCLARNVRISIRWIPSEFNSSDKGSREHNNARDPTESLANHLGSNEKQTHMVYICESESPTRSGEVATKQDLFPEILSGAAEESKTLRKRIWTRWSQRIGRDTIR